MTTFRLAIEEVAFAMGIRWGRDHSGRVPRQPHRPARPEELTGRLTAASHSLMARAC